MLEGGERLRHSIRAQGTSYKHSFGERASYDFMFSIIQDPKNICTRGDCQIDIDQRVRREAL